jgi:cell division topological specificity factor
MSLLSFLFGKRNPSASVAKERLQIVLAHERASRTAPDFLPMLQREILLVVAKYIDVDEEAIKVHLEKEGEVSVLEINVEMDQARIKKRPASAGAPRARRAAPARVIAKN